MSKIYVVVERKERTLQENVVAFNEREDAVDWINNMSRKEMYWIDELEIGESKEEKLRKEHTKEVASKVFEYFTNNLKNYDVKWEDIDYDSFKILVKYETSKGIHDLSLKEITDMDFEDCILEWIEPQGDYLSFSFGVIYGD